MIKDSGERTEFQSGAVRDMHEGKGRFDLLPMCVLLRLARHYENGCKKYGDRNWEKGIPCHSFADSAMRHLVKYMDGQTDEDHLIAAIWNLCGLAWTEEKHPELMDIPARLETSEPQPKTTERRAISLDMWKATQHLKAAVEATQSLVEVLPEVIGHKETGEDNG